MERQIVPRARSGNLVVRDEQGKEIVRPDVVQAVVQLATLAQLVRIRRSLEKEQFQGRLDTRTLSATDQMQFIDLDYQHPRTPWVSAYLINDGPNAVKIAVNAPFDFDRLKLSETRTLDYAKADRRIEKLYYQCDSGGTASVRVVGQY